VSSRIWTGLWQLSSPEWGTAKASKVRQAMKRYVEMGYNGFGMRFCFSVHSTVDTFSDMVCLGMHSVFIVCCN